MKDAVWERDGRCCIYCGTPNAFPEAHYIARSHGGLGIEQNILTLCRNCHDAYDRGQGRRAMRAVFREYLKGIYPEWNEKRLVYVKGETDA